MPDLVTDPSEELHVAYPSNSDPQQLQQEQHEHEHEQHKEDHQSFESACLDVIGRSHDGSVQQQGRHRRQQPQPTDAMTKTVLLLKQRVVNVKSTIRLKGRQVLHIRYDPPTTTRQLHGLAQDGKAPINAVIRATNDVHSIFLLDNNSKLILENVDLSHGVSSVADPSPPSPALTALNATLDASTQNKSKQQQQQQQQHDHTQVGAIINLRNKASAHITNGIIHSTSGFCCWAVQKTKLHLRGCHFSSTLRSAVVCFGSVRCEFDDCRIVDCGVHGICARGPCHLDFRHCQFHNHAIRALYAYADARVRLHNCDVTGTLRCDKAAIEVLTMPSQKGQRRSHLQLVDCTVRNNNGAGVVIRGDSSCEIEHSTVEDNRGAIDGVQYLPATFDATTSTSAVATTASSKFHESLRIGDDSSCRVGDWICRQRHCPRPSVIKATVASCPFCQQPKSKDGNMMLLPQQVLECNRFGPAALERILGDLVAPPSTQQHQQTQLHASLNPCHAVWMFDGDEKGWIAYDAESCRLLEARYSIWRQSEREHGCDATKQHLVELSNGKYQVDLELMQQVNTHSQFLRYVKRNACEESE